MTIKFPCPHCKKMLSVKEHLAGKKAACPACKQPITIPQPATAPAAPEPDLEALAAAAFAHEPAKKEETPPQFVEFQCYYCDEKVKVNAELAGKQTPCPECRRIVKVPQLVKEGPKDWRKVDTRTPLVAQRNEPAPEGAWGSTTSTGNVSRTSLEEAAALPAAAEVSGAKRWLLRGGLAAVVLLAGAGAWWGISGWMRTRLEAQLVAKVEAFLRDDTTTQPESAAELERALGHYHQLTHKADQALIRFAGARARLAKDDLTSRERDFVLADLAANQVELGGTQQEVDDGRRVPWEKALREVVQTLVKIRHHDVRVEAVRLVSRRLIARGEGKRAPALAAQVGSADEVPELVAVAGLELLAAKLTQEAALSAELALQRFQEPPPGDTGEPKEIASAPGEPPAKAKDAAARRAPLTPSLIALWVALNKTDDQAKFPPPPPTGSASDTVLVAGYAEGLGHRGEPDLARKTINHAIPEGRIPAYAGLAAALVAQGQADAARAVVEEALKLLEREPRLRQLVPAADWLRLVRVGTQAGMADQLRPAAAAISDMDLKGRAQLEILRGRLATTRQRADDDHAQEVDRNLSAYPLALEAIARHNARVDGPRSARTSVDGWESEKHRPFGWIGVAIGSRGAR